GFEIIARWEQTVGAYQASNLKEESVKRGEVYESQPAEKNPACPEMPALPVTGLLRSEEPIRRVTKQRKHRSRLYRSPLKWCRRRTGTGTARGAKPCCLDCKSFWSEKESG